MATLATNWAARNEAKPIPKTLKAATGISKNIKPEYRLQAKKSDFLINRLKFESAPLRLIPSPSNK